VKNASYGIVIPSFKEADNIAGLIQEILHVVPDAVVAVVDDSPDLSTVQAAESLGLAQVHVFHRKAKGGRGSAVLQGVRFLLTQNCSIIVEMDADSSHPPTQIPELVAYLQQHQLDLVIASRYLPTSRILNWPAARRLFSRCSNLLARAVLRIPITDYTNGYRVYSRTCAESIAEHCGRYGKGFIALSEILVSAYYRGFRVGEVPTLFTNRLRGESSLTWQEIKNAAFGLVTIAFLKRQLQKEHRAAQGLPGSRAKADTLHGR
jgi:dolichol-phosphate mannosyltransferase